MPNKFQAKNLNIGSVLVKKIHLIAHFWVDVWNFQYRWAMGCTIKKQIAPRIFHAKNWNIGSFLVKKNLIGHFWVEVWNFQYRLAMGCTIKKTIVPRIFHAKNWNIGSFLVKKCKKGILKKFGFISQKRPFFGSNF